MALANRPTTGHPTLVAVQAGTRERSQADAGGSPMNRIVVPSGGLLVKYPKSCGSKTGKGFKVPSQMDLL